MMLDSALESAAAQHAPTTRHVLRLRRLHATARLGHEAAERAEPQAVMLSVTVRFALAPEACRSDRLEDTVCGAELGAALLSVCNSGEFALIEHLAQRLHAAARRLVAPRARVRLELTKVAPPIPGLAGGMSFVISD
jgi:dihydroneopterin aldolase